MSETTTTTETTATETQQQTQQTQQQSAPPPPPEFTGKFSDLLSEDGTKFKDGWANALPDHLKPFEKTLSKFPSPLDALAAYGNLEKQFSSRKAPTPPGADATDEQRAEWRKLTGAPATPEEYGLKPAEGAEWNADLANAAATIAHKHGIPPAALHELVEAYNGNMKAAAEQAEQMQANAAQEAMAVLTKEWGQDAQKNSLRAVRGAKALTGLDLTDPANAKYANDPVFVKAMLAYDAQTNEDKGLVGVNDASGYETQEQSIRNSPEYQGKKGPEAQAAAVEKLRRLFEARMTR